MKQYQKGFEIKNQAKDNMEGKYSGAIRIFLFSFLISGFVRLSINSVCNATMNSVFVMTGSPDAARTISYVFDLLLFLANVILGVMNAGITLYFLKTACGQPAFLRDLFYGFQTDSKKFLLVSGAMTLCQTLCLGPCQYIVQNYAETRDIKWIIYALAALAAGLCVYIPISLGITLSFYLALDFPEKTGKETLALCWHVMKGQRMRLFLLELGFLPLMLLCILSFGIGFLWLQPYMQMTHTCFFLGLMNPRKVSS